MSAPRFVVTEFGGYPIPDTQGRRGGREKVSYYVQDTLYLYRVVATFEYRRGHMTDGRPALRRRAERHAARLNAEHEAELARG